MHSLSIAENILEAALTEAEKNQRKRIRAMTVEIEDPDFRERDSLQFCLQTMARGTLAEGARLEIHVAGGLAVCRECAYAYTANDYASPCPRCGAINAELLFKRSHIAIRLELE